MKRYILFCAIVVLSHKCEGHGILGGILSGVKDISSKVHGAINDVAHGAVHGPAQGFNYEYQHGYQYQYNQQHQYQYQYHQPPGQADEIVVVVDNQEPPHRPAHGHRPPPHSQSHNHHHPHNQHPGPGCNGPHNNGNGNCNGNPNVNANYGNQKPNNYENPIQNNFGNYKPNKYGNQNSYNYGSPNQNYGPPNSYNNGNINSYGNPISSEHQQVNQNNYVNNQNDVTTPATLKPIDRPKIDYSEKPTGLPYGNQNSYGNNQNVVTNLPIGLTTSKPMERPKIDYSEKPTGHPPNANGYDKQEITKKPSDDLPLYVPLNSDQYVYGGDKIEINAPKRETNENTKAAEDDEDELYPIDIRFGKNKNRHP